MVTCKYIYNYDQQLLAIIVSYEQVATFTQTATVMIYIDQDY